MIKPLYDYMKEEREIQKGIIDDASIDFQYLKADCRRPVVKWEIEYAKKRHNNLIRRNRWGKTK